MTGFQSNYNIVNDKFSLNGDTTMINFTSWKAKGFDSRSFIATAAQLFANTSTANYQLSSTSAAINKGSANPVSGVQAPLTDLLGALRNVGAPDIGAYEFGGVASSTDPSTPSDPSLPSDPEPSQPSQPVVIVPVAPSALVAKAMSSTQVQLSWADNSDNETSFIVERKSGTSSFQQIASLGAGSSSYTNNNLLASTQYTYRVAAMNSAGRANSNEVSVTTQAAPSVPTDPDPTTTQPPTVPAGTYTLFASSVAPTIAPDDDRQAVELGVKFHSSVAGSIMGIRFYKNRENTGTHIGNLWSASGQRLATATFVSETDSGWQQVLFAQPVAIQANTTYVASYHSDSGIYIGDDNYFASHTVSSGPLSVISGSAPSAYAYGASQFPSKSYLTENYYVDVVFSTLATSTPTDPQPPEVSAQLSSISLSPSQLVGGGVATVTINLSAAAPAAGVAVSLLSSRPAKLPVPSKVTVPAGQKMFTVQLQSQRVASNRSVTITATSGGIKKSAKLTLLAR